MKKKEPPIQIIDSELIITSTHMSSQLRRLIISLCGCLVFFVVMFSLLFVAQVQAATRISQFPAVQAEAYDNIHLFVVLFCLMLLFCGLTIAFLIYQLRRSAQPLMRINYEGIFLSPYSFLFRWEEINELVLFSFWGSPVLGIVPIDLECTVVQAKASSKWWVRPIIAIGLWIVRRAKSPTPIGITQRCCPSRLTNS